MNERQFPAVVPPRTWPILTCCLLWAIAGWSSLCLAQPPQRTPAPQGLAALVQEAQQLTQSAGSGEELTRLINICLQAQAQQLSEAHGKYFRELEAWARSRRGELYAEQANLATDEATWKKYEQAALRDFDLAVQKHPEMWQAVHHRAISLARLGEIEKALADLDTTLELNPRFASGWYNRGELRYQQGQYQEALEDYRKALQLEPQDVDAATGIAHSLYQLEKYREALQQYSAAIQIAPQDASRYADRGDAFSDLGFWEQAMADFKKSLELDGDLARSCQGLAWILATCPEEKFRQPEKAVELAERALELEAHADYRYFDTLAAAQASSGKFEGAMKAGEEAVQQAPESERTYLEYRLALYQKKKPYFEPKR